MGFSLKNISECTKPLLNCLVLIEQHLPGPVVMAVWFIDSIQIGLYHTVCCTVSSKCFYFKRVYKCFQDIEEIGLNMVVFQIQYIINCGREKCHDGLGSVWSGDKCVSFRGRHIKQQQAAVRWVVRNRRDRSIFDRWWDEIEMKSGIVGEKNSHTWLSSTHSGFLIPHHPPPYPYITFNVLQWSHGTNEYTHIHSRTHTNECVKLNRHSP